MHMKLTMHSKRAMLTQLLLLDAHPMLAIALLVQQLHFESHFDYSMSHKSTVESREINESGRARLTCE